MAGDTEARPIITAYEAVKDEWLAFHEGQPKLYGCGKTKDAAMADLRRKQTMSVFKIKYQAAPIIPHVYCRFFTASEPNMTYASCGSLTVRKNEFEDMKLAMPGVSFEEETDGPLTEQNH